MRRRWQPGCPCCETPLCDVLFDGVHGCDLGSCFVEGATVTVTQATLGFSASGTTNATGDVTIQVPCNTSVTFSYTIEHLNALTKSGTFTLDTGPPAGKTLSGTAVRMPTDADHFCSNTIGGNDFCGDPIPASLDVTVPNRPDTFGTLAGTTISVPRVTAFSAGQVSYSGCYAATGGCWSSVGVNIHLTGVLFCGNPGASVRFYQDSPFNPGCENFTGSGANYLANAFTGTITCPVAFTSTNGAYDPVGFACPGTSWSGTQVTVSE